jgi:hypothetical protein
MIILRGREVPKEIVEKFIRGIYSFRMVFWFLSLCFLVLSILLVCVIGYRFYLVESGEMAQGYIREKHSSRASRGYTYDGDFSYKERTYKISPVSSFDLYDVGPVDVYFNPEKPTTYLIHQGGMNKYLMVLFYGYEFRTLIILIVLGFFTTLGPIIFKPQRADVKNNTGSEVINPPQ